MGFIAEYLMIDDDTLDSMMDLSSEELSDKLIEELDEDETLERIDIDKLWDALHFFLTGVSASTPIDGDKLSEAVVGVHFFKSYDDNSDFITCIDNEELPEIIDALEKFDFDKRAAEFDPKTMKKHDLYPNGIWEDGKEQLLKEFKEVVNEMIEFYKKALAAKKHIIVSIL